MHVLITGSAGFIGSHLTEACLGRGWQITAIDSLTTYYSPSLKVSNSKRFSESPACRYLEEDLLEADLESILQDVDVIFHLAAQAGVRASWGEGFDVYTKLNVTALQRLLEAARRVDGLAKFVFASSSSVYGDAEAFPTEENQVLRPLSPYGATKALGEHLCHLYFRAFGLPTVGLRYFTVYGPRQRPDMAFHRLIEAGLAETSFSLYGDGNQTRDFTYVDDIVAGTLAASEKADAGSVLNIGGGSRISMTEVISIMQSEFPSLRIERLASGRGDARDTAADISKASRMIDYQPSTKVPDGILRQIEWHRQRRGEA